MALLALLGAACGGDEPGSGDDGGRSTTDTADERSSEGEDAAAGEQDGEGEGASDSEGDDLADAAQDYDAAVAPALDELAVLAERSASVMTKADGGQITIDVAAEGFGRQTADTTRLLEQVRAVSPSEEPFAAAHPDLVAGVEAWGSSMRTLATVRDADDQATFDGKLDGAIAELEQVVERLDSWETALAEHEPPVSLPRAAAAAQRFGAAASRIGG